NGSAVVVDDGLTVSDADDASLAGATVRIAGVQAGEMLEADPIPGIARAYDANTGTLALSGSATVAAYQAALTSVTYRSTNDDPAAVRTIRFQFDDGHATDGSSVVVTRAVDVTPVDDTQTV